MTVHTRNCPFYNNEHLMRFYCCPACNPGEIAPWDEVCNCESISNTPLPDDFIPAYATWNDEERAEFDRLFPSDADHTSTP